MGARRFHDHGGNVRIFVKDPRQLVDVRLDHYDRGQGFLRYTGLCVYARV